MRGKGERSQPHRRPRRGPRGWCRARPVRVWGWCALTFGGQSGVGGRLFLLFVFFFFYRAVCSFSSA